MQKQRQLDGFDQKIGSVTKFHSIFKNLSLIIISVWLIVAHGSEAFGQGAAHLWYNDSGHGDVMMIDVNVTDTASTTYFEALGWNQGGEAGGYTGIQTHPKGNLYIFSIWNSIAKPTVPIKAVYQKPGSEVSPFGGEGTGLRYLDFTTNWSVGKPVTIVVRRWAAETGTNFGMWSRNSATNDWTHHATFEFPVEKISFEHGAMSFVENWSGLESNKIRRAEFFNGWKRSNGAWSAFSTAKGNPAARFGVGPNMRYILQTGAEIEPVFQNPLQLPVQTTSPSLPKARIDQLITTWDHKTKAFKLDWVINPTGAPQFAYRVDLVNATNNKLIISSTKSSPQTRTFTHRLSRHDPSPSAIRARLTIIDLIDREVVGTKSEKIN